MKAKWILSILIGLGVQNAFAGQLVGQKINVSALNEQLKTQHAGWVAKETWLSHLSKDEVKYHFGLAENLAPEIEFADNAPHALSTNVYPATLDWRNKDGVNWVSPLLNQANCGSCVAFASIGVMETQERIASGNANYNISLSPQNLFACGGGGCETGWMPDDAADFLQSKGVVDEACQPYLSGATGQDLACSASCKDAAKRTYKIASFSKPTAYFKNLDALRAALQKGPLVTTLSVYEDFMSYSSGVYKHTTGKFLGGHAISIVGYDDTTQSFIIRNSWGPEWGEQGFAHVSYTDLSGVGAQTWAFEIPAATGSVFIQSPHDYTYASNTMALKTQSTIAKTDSLSVTIFDAQGKSVQNITCAANCDQNVNISGLADGQYTIQTTAMDNVGHALSTSPIQGFVVANSQPQISLKFAGKGFDMKSPLKARVEFDLTSTSTTVPLSSIEFHYKDASGVEHKKAVTVVIPQMTMGWRTNLMANGQYEIWFVGHLKTNQFDAVAETPHQLVQTQN